MLNHLADVSIRAVVLAAIAAAVVWLPTRKRAAMEHAVWTAVVCGMLGLFVFGRVLPHLPVRVLEPLPHAAAPPAANFNLPVPGESSVPVQPPAPTAQLKIDRLGDWFALGYAAIALAFFARFALGMFLVRRLIAGSTPLGRFRESDRIAVPLTVGSFRPQILLPIDWREWHRAKLDAVLAHESAHSMRHDGLIAAIARMNRCLFWFHPLAWWLERRLALLAELACDEACVAELGDREAYARLLVEIAQVVDASCGRLRGHALTMAAGSHIGKRIESILREERAFSRGLTRAGWSAIALCGVPLIWGAGAVVIDRQAPLSQREMPPLALSPVDAPKPPILLAQARPAPATSQTKSPAPAPEARVQFEVASIRPAAPAPNARRCFATKFTMDAGRVDITCMSLQELMEHAFWLPQKQVGGPDWLHYHGGPQFDISAKLPPGASEDQVPEMLQALLIERFKLVFHRESKEQNVDALVVAKGGLKLEEAPPASTTAAAAPDTAASPAAIETVNGIPTRLAPQPNSRTAAQINSRIGDFRVTANRDTLHWELSSTTMAGLADAMAETLKRPMVDMTGLKGRYHMELDVKNTQWDPAALAAAETMAAMSAVIDDSLTALRNNFNPELQKLGLQLETRKAPVETIVVDRVEQTPTEN
jgi:uncharacterized protein (TIGR03435 family)